MIEKFKKHLRTRMTEEDASLFFDELIIAAMFTMVGAVAFIYRHELIQWWQG